MIVGLSFVAIEVEELSLGKVYFGGDLINLVVTLNCVAKNLCSLVDGQSSIGAVLLKIGLSHCLNCLRYHRAM